MAARTHSYGAIQWRLSSEFIYALPSIWSTVQRVHGVDQFQVSNGKECQSSRLFKIPYRTYAPKSHRSIVSNRYIGWRERERFCVSIFRTGEYTRAEKLLSIKTLLLLTLRLPSWVDNISRYTNDTLKQIIAVHMESFSHTNEMKKFRGGFLIKEMYDRYWNRIIQFSFIPHTIRSL